MSCIHCHLSCTVFGNTSDQRPTLHVAYGFPWVVPYSQFELKTQMRYPLHLYLREFLFLDIAMVLLSSKSDPIDSSALSSTAVSKLAFCYSWYSNRLIDFLSTNLNCRSWQPCSWLKSQISNEWDQLFLLFSIVFGHRLHYTSCFGVFVGLPCPYFIPFLQVYVALPHQSLYTLYHLKCANNFSKQGDDKPFLSYIFV